MSELFIIIFTFCFTGKLNFVIKFPIMIILFLTICIFIMLVPFFLFGGSFKFGIGPFFKFGISGKTNSNKKQERIERISEVYQYFSTTYNFVISEILIEKIIHNNASY